MPFYMNTSGMLFQKDAPYSCAIFCAAFLPLARTLLALLTQLIRPVLTVQKGQGDKGMYDGLMMHACCRLCRALWKRVRAFARA